MVSAACASGSSQFPTYAPSPESVFPEAEWERIAPAEVGWSGEALEAVRTELEQLETTALMAVVGGRVIFEYGDVESVSYIASVRKSILSILFGRYVADGTVDLDLTLAEIGIDDHQSLSDRERQATVRHLLSARSGVYHPAANSGDNLSDAPPRGSQAPGEYHLYSNWDFNALGTVFETLTGQNIFDALQADLVEPLGMRDFDRERHEKGGNLGRSMHPSYHMHLSTRDMARVGYLMLRHGEWDGRQVVPRSWVDASTAAVTRRTEMNPERLREGRWGYGYLWWIFDDPDQHPAYDGAYLGRGLDGQHILVVPSLDLVVAHKTIRDGGRRVSHDQFMELVANGMIQAHCGTDC